MVLLRTPTPGMTAVRLSLPYPVSHAYEADLAVEVARARLQESAAFIGAAVDVTRSPAAVAITVTGASEDLDFMGSILRRSVERPSSLELVRARRVTDVAGDPVRETGLAYLRATAAPSCASAANLEATRSEDTKPSAAAPNSSHGLGTLVVASDQPASRLQTALAELIPMLLDGLDQGPSPETPTPQTTERPLTPPNPPDPPNTLRSWHGVWWTLPNPRAPALSVLANFATDPHRHADPDRLLEGMEILEARCAVAVLAWEAAYPARRSGQANRVASRLDRIAADLNPRSVAATVQRTRLSARRSASTPAGLVDLVGGPSDRTGIPTAAATWFEAMATVDEGDVRDLLDALQASGTRHAGTR